jgi:hypothetical protein
MRQAAFPRESSSAPPDLQEGKVLLLGVLTLTARFHPELVAHHSQHHANEPQSASEYYANALAAAFGPTSRNLTNPSLEGIQALLMLGLYEWGQTRGLSAWVYVGIAVRLAFSMGLAFEDDPDIYTHKSPSQDPRKVSSGRHLNPTREDAIEKEVRRRTLWSCFIMDRMLSAGKFRPTMMSAEKLRVQLPCSDDQFLFVHNVQTGFLNSDWLSDAARNAPVSEDGVLSRYIRLVEIFGRFSEWSYAGGRRTEKLPPWDPNTQFSKLRRQLEDFHDSLPPSLTFTEANLSAHIEKRNATTYASMHTLYSLCLIMLHREYIPFIPLRCDKPQGPLDEPTFPKNRFNAPEGFWEDSAERMFKAAKDIVDIVRTCQDNNALPESPQIGFAVWQAAFVCVYAIHFDHMDTGRHLQNSEVVYRKGDVRNKGYAGLTAKILDDMVPKLRMAKGYLKMIVKMHDYFQNVKVDYYHHFKRGTQPPGWSGGGLEQYKVLEKELKEFGSLSDTDRNIPSDGSDVVDQNRSRASTNDIPGSSSVNGEPMQGVEAAPQRPNGAWAAINAASPPVEADERPKFNQTQYPYGVPYQHSPNQSSNASSMISASNGDSTPGLNSPYSNPGHHGQQQQQHYQLPNQQPQHAATYPSIAQHTMAPPNPQQGGNQRYTDEEKYENFIQFHEGIQMNARFDNLAQEYSMDTWNGLPTNMQAGVPINYLDAINMPPRSWG